MTLVGVPGRVGDGTKLTLGCTRADAGVVDIGTCVGKAPTRDTPRHARIGPNDCEITGITDTAHGKAFFVNVQPPGESMIAAKVRE